MQLPRPEEGMGAEAPSRKLVKKQLLLKERTDCLIMLTFICHLNECVITHGDIGDEERCLLQPLISLVHVRFGSNSHVLSDILPLVHTHIHTTQHNGSFHNR